MPLVLLLLSLAAYLYLDPLLELQYPLYTQNEWVSLDYAIHAFSFVPMHLMCQRPECGRPSKLACQSTWSFFCAQYWLKLASILVWLVVTTTELEGDTWRGSMITGCGVTIVWTGGWGGGGSWGGGDKGLGIDPPYKMLISFFIFLVGRCSEWSSRICEWTLANSNSSRIQRVISDIPECVYTAPA